MQLPTLKDSEGLWRTSGTCPIHFLHRLILSSPRYNSDVCLIQKKHLLQRFLQKFSAVCVCFNEWEFSTGVGYFNVVLSGCYACYQSQKAHSVTHSPTYRFTAAHFPFQWNHTTNWKWMWPQCLYTSTAAIFCFIKKINDYSRLWAGTPKYSKLYIWYKLVQLYNQLNYI